MTSLTRCVGVIGAIWVVGVAQPAISAEYRHQTPNFTVQASTPEIARQVGDAAEYFRREIARQWLGTELPKWSARCPIRVKVGQIGAGGQTTFNFHPVANGPSEVCDWNMEVQGSLERILDSVIPHEVSHTIFACYFRRPLPRWADEGAATLVECESERRRQVLTVEQVIQTRNRIPLNQLLAIKEYPRDHTAVMTLYAEGYSLAEWLVQQGGRPRFLEFLELAHQQGWPTAINRCYQLESIDALEKRWQEWVMAGSPELPGRNGAPATLVAQAEPPNATDPNGLRGEATRSAAPSASPAGRGRETTSPARPRPDRQLAASTPSQRPNLGDPAGEAARVRGQSPSEPDEPLPQRPSRDADLVAMGNRLTAPSPTRRSGTTALGEPEPLADSRAPARPSSRTTDPNGLRGEATRAAAPSASPAGRGRETTSPARPRPDRQLAASTPSQRPNLGEPAGETALVRGQSPSEPDEPLPQRPSRDAELVAMGNRLTAPSPTRRSGTTALGEPEPLADSRAPARPSSRTTDPAPWETDADPRLDRDLGPQVAGGGAQESFANGSTKPASRPLPQRGRAQSPRDDLERGANAVAMGDEFAEPEESPPASLGALASRSNPTRSSRSSPGGNSTKARGELNGNPVTAGVAPRSVSRVTRSEFPDDAWPAGRLPRR